ncbi:carbohydrate ABC transporter permease [Kribbella sp.]|uniref:carbohydrate ABC transporter permease n=1 Tax=Kribbella sp. TaxID=1871183 RepID=UPI002D6AAA55|nr:carbohydrate ABC transporter permease [Kribbella sp.]HZX07503.1 carbohydrate ABC transporter permease [Kribbella sp.]
MAVDRPVWMGRPSPAVRGAKGLVVAVIGIVMLYPFLNVIATSLAQDADVRHGGLVPHVWSLEAYRSILQGGIVGRALLVSAGVTLTGTVLSMICTSTMAYGLTRTRDLPGMRFVLYLALFTMLFSAGLIPNFLLIKNLGLLNSYAALVVPGLVSAFNLVVLRNFYLQIPRELIEAARIDGCNDRQIYTSIVLPLSKAVHAVLALFYAVGYWNAFFNALLYISDADKWPIQLVLNLYVVQGSPIPQVDNPNSVVPTPQSIQMAVVVLALLPILLVYPFLQKYFTKGVLTGAIKG